MLERLWRNGDPHSLLVGMQTGAASMENSMESPQKIKNRGGVTSASWRSEIPSLNLCPLRHNENIIHIPTELNQTLRRTSKKPLLPYIGRWRRGKPERTGGEVRSTPPPQPIGKDSAGRGRTGEGRPTAGKLSPSRCSHRLSRDPHWEATTDWLGGVANTLREPERKPPGRAGEREDPSPHTPGASA